VRGRCICGVRLGRRPRSSRPCPLACVCRCAAMRLSGGFERNWRTCRRARVQGSQSAGPRFRGCVCSGGSFAVTPGLCRARVCRIPNGTRLTRPSPHRNVGRAVSKATQRRVVWGAAVGSEAAAASRCPELLAAAPCEAPEVPSHTGEHKRTSPGSRYSCCNLSAALYGGAFEC
jgi:hypothetical protein